MFIGSGTVINVMAIGLGATLGTIVARILSKQFRMVITDIMGLMVALVAALNIVAITKPEVQDTFRNGTSLLIIMGSLLIGTGLGSFLRIESRLESLGRRFSSIDEDASKLTESMTSEISRKTESGFLTATLIFCVGPMAILGSLNDGLGLGNETLVVKSALDFFTSVALAATFGIGVAFSAVAVGMYQGVLTYAGYMLGEIMTDVQVDMLTATGGLILIALSLRLMNIKQFPIGNMLPALAIVPLVVWLLAK